MTLGMVADSMEVECGALERAEEKLLDPPRPRLPKSAARNAVSRVEVVVSPDVQVESRLRAALLGTGYPQLSGVGIEADSEGEQLLLTGVLDSFYLKQVAQEIARETLGLWRVNNCIEVTMGE